jgi:hypothetical protein
MTAIENKIIVTLEIVFANPLNLPINLGLMSLIRIGRAMSVGTVQVLAKRLSLKCIKIQLCVGDTPEEGK